MYLGGCATIPDFPTQAFVDSCLGEVIRALYDNGKIPRDRPPKPCSDPTDDDHFYETITTSCVRQYAWTGTVNGAAVSSQGLVFCKSQAACLRKWKVCTDSDGIPRCMLDGTFPLGGDGCTETSVDSPYVMNGVYDGLNLTILNRAQGHACAPTCQP